MERERRERERERLEIVYRLYPSKVLHRVLACVCDCRDINYQSLISIHEMTEMISRRTHTRACPDATITMKRSFISAVKLSSYVHRRTSYIKVIRTRLKCAKIGLKAVIIERDEVPRVIVVGVIARRRGDGRNGLGLRSYRRRGRRRLHAVSQIVLLISTDISSRYFPRVD